MIKSGVVTQYYASIIANFATICYAIGIGWSSPVLPILLSENTPLPSGPLSLNEATTVSSLLCIGGLFGTMIFGVLCDKIGRRNSCLLSAFPYIASWLLIAFAQNEIYLYIGRFLVGLGGGASFVIIPLYVSEISEDDKRGKLGSLLMLTTNFGILLGYFIGSYMSYYMMSWIAVIPVILFISFYFLPETPRYLLSKNKIPEAENSLKYFRSTDYIISGKFKKEFENLKLNLILDKNNDTVKFKDFNTRAARKAIIIAFILMTMTQLGGIFTILNYTSTILKDAGSSIDPNLSLIIIALIQVVAAYLSTLLVDKVGRRWLMLFSFIGTGIGHTVLGFFIYFKSLGYNLDSYSWIPVVSISEILFLGSLGMQTLPYVIVSEIFPQKTRSLIYSWSVSWSWFTAFLIVKYFTTLVEIIGLYGSFGLFGTCCFLTAIFVYYCMPETKGISIEEVIELLETKK